LYRFTTGLLHCETDQEGKVVYVNQQLCRHSGYEKSEFLGKRCDKILFSGTPKETLDQIRRHVLKGRDWEGLLRYQRKDGRHFWAYTQASIRKKEGKSVGIAFIGRPAASDEITKKELEFEIQSIQEKARK